MQTHISTSSIVVSPPNPIATEPASAIAMAVSAFAILVFRYTRESSLDIGISHRPSREVERIQVEVSDDLSPEAILSCVTAKVARVLDAAVTIDGSLRMSWTELPGCSPDTAEDGAVLALTARLSTLTASLEQSVQRGVLLSDNPLKDVERHFRRVVESLRSRRVTRVGDVPLLDSNESLRLLHTWSREETRPEFAEPGLLHELFEARARANPERSAVICHEVTMTYGELDAKAERLARGLRARGIGPGSLVAFQLPRSIDVYVAILGVLKAGAGYVPLDPEYPRDRVEYILVDGKVDVFLTVASLTDKAVTYPCPLVCLDDDWDVVLAEAESPAQRLRPAPTDVCYVIYTSGSTGRPKGVAVEHQSARHLVRAEQYLFSVLPSDKVFQGFSIAFDAAVEEVWLAFAAGATLVVGTKQVILADLSQYITDTGVTIFSTVPTLLATLTGDLPTVRLLIVGGEACPQDIVKRWATLARRMFNTYGPTEATVIATYAELHPTKAVTIGRPIPNYTTYILDPAGKPVPAGIPGELCIGGVGLARGYVGKPELTADRFVSNPFASDGPGGARLYKTGDRARYTPTGDIDFMGRLDDQVKLRGFRIELGEIESALMAADTLSQALVVVRGDSSDTKQLVAYVVPRPETPAGSVSSEALKEHLRKRLPPYMVPAYIEILARMPTLSSGKVDRRSLPPPSQPTVVKRDASTLPRNPIEEKIVNAWVALFGVATVSRDEHFFHDLGGHSLLVARMVSGLRQDSDFEALSVVDAYENATPALLAARVQMTARPTGVGPAEAAVLAETRQADKAVRSSPLVHFACAAAQVIGLYFIFGIYSTQWLAPYLMYVRLRVDQVNVVGALVLTLGVLFAFYPALLLLTLVAKWLIIGRYKAGRYPLWGLYYFRWWLVDRIIAITPIGDLAGTPLINLYYRLLGARIGSNVTVAADAVGSFDLVSVGDDSTIGIDSDLSGSAIEDGMLVLGPVTVGKRCVVGARSVLSENSMMEDDSSLGELSLLPRGATLPKGEAWAGSPARPVGMTDAAAPIARPSGFRRVAFGAVYAVCIFFLPLFTLSAMLPSLVTLNFLERHWGGYWYLLLSPISAICFVLILCFEIVAAKWVLLGKAKAGTFPVFGIAYLRKWLFDQAIGVSLEVLGALYASLFLNPWYRLLGVRLGKNAEVSTASSLAPDLLHIDDGAFIADSVSIGTPRIDRGYMKMEHTFVGKRAFIGNSSVIASGTRIGDDCLVGCISVAPADPAVAAQSGLSWLGSPAIALPSRQVNTAFSEEATYRPTARLKAMRLAIEFLRVILPTTGFVVFTCLILTFAIHLYEKLSLVAFCAVFPLMYVAFGIVVAGTVVALKWGLMGRYRPGEKPLWSAFVWRTELVTAMHENLANPFIIDMLEGTPFVAWFFRALGAKIGRRVYMGTTEFTEYDLVEIGDEVCLNTDCTVQTHLFEDRVMKMSTVRIGNGCTVGANAVVLYDTEMADGSVLGPLSLLMKGETLPANTRWEGSPASPVRRFVREPSPVATLPPAGLRDLAPRPTVRSRRPRNVRRNETTARSGNVSLDLKSTE